MATLGVMLTDGEGVKKDYPLAAQLFRLSAEQGVDIGEHNLALAYRNG